MATNFPASQDDSTTLPNPSSTDKTNSPDHAGIHGNANDAIKALEAKLGTGASTPVANRLLYGNGTGTSAWTQLTSSQLAASLSDETGTGSAVFASTPTLITPKADTINESSAGNGVTIDGVNLKDGALNTNNSVVGANITAGVVTPDKLVSGAPSTHTFQTFSPTITGFSSNPASGLYYYQQIGKLVVVFVTQPNAGTSNATSFTISLPVTARTVTGANWSGYGVVVDNGTVQTNPGLLLILSGGTTMNVYSSFFGAGWTNSGNKRLAYGSIMYEAA